EAIESGLRELCASFGEATIFCGDREQQVTGRLFRGDRGLVTPIENTTTALAALEEIVKQGEGADHAQVWDGDRDPFHPERKQIAHYYRFDELKKGRRYRSGDTPESGPTGDVIGIDWDGVKKMRANPSSSEHAAGSAVYTAQREFNLTYCLLLRQLDH